MRIYNPTKILLIFIISGFLIFTGKIRVEADQLTADAVNALSTTTIQLITGQTTIPTGFVGLSTKLDVLTSTTNAGFEILTSTTDTGFTNVTNELRRGNSREEADKLKSYILNKCKNNLISGYTGLNGGVLEIKDILWSIDLYELQDTIIKNNSAANNGGAFSIVNSEKVSFYNVNVFDNEAVVGKGGAFYIENSTVIFNTTKVSNIQRK
ncbi:hypothetical protein [Candidatus Endomicrobiellum devescovinae]|uniref:hypothetical protein n=1 Tax=Candidatus Endomicrobiellum devescovinae TaxID=3242322 RepID=UPI00282A66D2|nr:hypothetical protein [Endomicrobium sp.]